MILRLNTTESPLILSSEAAQDLEGLLHAVPLLGDELHKFVEQIRAALRKAEQINSDGNQAVLQIIVYPVDRT